MNDKNTHFPQYRKLKNGLRLYKINSPNYFEELQILGDRVFHFAFTAEQYPEKLRIMDMLDSSSEYYSQLEGDSWEEKRRSANL